MPEKITMPDINEEELLLHAEHMMQAPDLSGYSYPEVVRILTVANYVSDPCIKEIEDRELLTWNYSPDGRSLAVVIPDARPPGMFVEHVLTRPSSAGQRSAQYGGAWRGRVGRRGGRSA